VVIPATSVASSVGALLAQHGPSEKLSPPASAAVLMALLGVALLGLLIVVLILLGGNWVRKQGNFRRGPSVPPDRRPLSRRPSEGSPPAPAGGDENDAASHAGVDTVRERSTNRDETAS
jgi:hypothetical protein